VLENIQLTEIIATARRREIEHLAERRRLLAHLDPAPRAFQPRRAIAAGLVRLAMIIDASAGRRAAAGAH
jgi:hypothetical protein